MHENSTSFTSAGNIGANASPLNIIDVKLIEMGMHIIPLMQP
jgi:hypothetical protein